MCFRSVSFESLVLVEAIGRWQEEFSRVGGELLPDLSGDTRPANGEEALGLNEAKRGSPNDRPFFGELKYL